MVPFNPITIGGGCTDPGSIISYEVTLPNTLDAQYVKLSADSYSNELRLMALTGGTGTGSHTITVTGTLPDSVTQETFTFTVIVS